MPHPGHVPDKGCMTCECVQSEEVGDDREDNRLFYDYLGKAYKAFLDGNDEQESQVRMANDPMRLAARPD